MAETEGRTAFEAAIAEIDRRIEELQIAKQTLLGLIGASGTVDIPAPLPQGVRPTVGDPLAVVREQEFHGLSAAEAAKVFLKRTGAAQKTPVILSAIHKGGVAFGGKNPISGLYTTLARHSAFVSLKKNYWDLAERRPDLAAQKQPRPQKTKGTKRRRTTRTGNSTKPKVLKEGTEKGATEAQEG